MEGPGKGAADGSNEETDSDEDLVGKESMEVDGNIGLDCKR